MAGSRAHAVTTIENNKQLTVGEEKPQKRSSLSRLDGATILFHLNPDPRIRTQYRVAEPLTITLFDWSFGIKRNLKKEEKKQMFCQKTKYQAKLEGTLL